MNNSTANFLSLSGRIDRQTFTRRFITIIVLTVCIVGHMWLTGLAYAPSMELMYAMMSITWLIFHVVLWMQVVKRLHDQGREGTLALISFIPFVGLFYALAQAFIRGSGTENEYGDVPSGHAVAFNAPDKMIKKVGLRSVANG